MFLSHLLCGKVGALTGKRSSFPTRSLEKLTSSVADQVQTVIIGLAADGSLLLNGSIQLLNYVHADDGPFENIKKTLIDSAVEGDIEGGHIMDYPLLRCSTDWNKVGSSKIYSSILTAR